ncbi:hypothetical protein [Corynebacterium gerontici]|uniref:Uncharacterized protein n=1 Tax=Corynebacterium gerontici TaxID=2079234 RepID=A0A3G6IZ94_9CORY|nr:hypothetical protein [Corynebacterium gerontici]AZA11111.1 hypothetical protein CGERO_03970 [Corynebacterium gerontici]
MDDFTYAKRLEQAQSGKSIYWVPAMIGGMTGLIFFLLLQRWPLWIIMTLVVLMLGIAGVSSYRNGVRVATRQPVDAQAPMPLSAVALMVVWMLAFSMLSNSLRETIAAQSLEIQVLACLATCALTALVFWRIEQEREKALARHD